MPAGSFLEEYKAMRRFQKLSAAQRKIVFYAESGAFWGYFEQIIHSLVRKYDQQICYLTSSPEDAVLQRQDGSVLPFYIGTGAVRTWLFRTLEARVCVMTMPDLDRFYIKRSKYPVHYAFVPHNTLSTHMVFRKGAFDHYDSFLCVGLHHVAELREGEEIYGLKPRCLVEHGYGRIDAILEEVVKRRPVPRGDGARTLIAPSWGPEAIFETGIGEPMVASLLESGCQVRVRPHPDTRRLAGDKLDAIYARFAGNRNFCWEENVASIDSFYDSDVMISDWSGAAFEFALALERPVIFLDVPRKVNNPEYQRFKNPPVEIGLRSEIGVVVSPREIQSIPGLLKEFQGHREEWASRIRSVRQRYIFNIGRSGEVGADYLYSLACRDDT